MKVFACIAITLLAVQHAAAADADPIGAIVGMLKSMQTKSKADAAQEATDFSAFQAFYQSSSDTKKKAISDEGISIEVLGNRITELFAEKAKLESDIADLKRNIDQNFRQQNDSTAARNNENKAYLAMKQDFTDRIARLQSAVDTLGAVGGDQTQNLKAALLSIDEASASMAEEALAKIQDLRAGFLQVPSEQKPQSGAVTGVLKSVLDTSKKDLQAATDAESKADSDYQKLMTTLKADNDAMQASLSSKSAQLSADVTELSDKQGTLETTKATKASDEAILANLQQEWKNKSAINEERLALRAGEDKAIQTALVFLDGDRANKVFKKVKTTAASLLDEDEDEDVVSFVQLHEVRRHNHFAGTELALLHLLRKAARETHSTRLAEVAALVTAAAPNPFKQVLEEIEKMKVRIVEEGDVDLKQFNWCATERAANKQDKQSKEDAIVSLQGMIESLNNSIENPQSGLKVSIIQTADSITANMKEQAAQTKVRKGEHSEYLKNINNLVTAEDMMKKALSTLKEFYAHMAEVNAAKLLQLKHAAAPATPAAKSYAGQSDNGNAVINMIQQVLGDTTAEEMLAHQTEAAGQAAFEDSMKLLTDQMNVMNKQLQDAKTLLAQSKQDLEKKLTELDSTQQERKAIMDYLFNIKPTCDFITANLDNRNASRITEAAALDQAKGLITNSPAYKNHEAKMAKLR